MNKEAGAERRVLAEKEKGCERERERRGRRKEVSDRGLNPLTYPRYNVFTEEGEIFS